MAAAANVQIWTFGHSTRSEAETIDLLASFDIAEVVDIRSIRGSRHNPWFGEHELPGWLAKAQIGYRWLASLGGRRRKQDVPPEVNGGWHNASFHSYADWTLSSEFAAGLETLTEWAATSKLAIMCSEAVPWRCHRSLVSTILSYRDWQVHHMMSRGHALPHTPGQWGATPVLHSNGTVTYPETATTAPAAARQSTSGH